MKQTEIQRRISRMRIASFEMDVERPRGPLIPLDDARFPAEWVQSGGIPLGTSSSTELRFCVEKVRGRELDFEQVTQPLVKRDWDVTDPVARERAAFDRLGEDELRDHAAWYEVNAQWYINPRRNTAALLVYREWNPKEWAQMQRAKAKSKAAIEAENRRLAALKPGEGALPGHIPGAMAKAWRRSHPKRGTGGNG